MSASKKKKEKNLQCSSFHMLTGQKTKYCGPFPQLEFGACVMQLEVLWVCVSGNENTACGERSWMKKESN